MNPRHAFATRLSNEVGRIDHQRGRPVEVLDQHPPSRGCRPGHRPQHLLALRQMFEQQPRMDQIERTLRQSDGDVSCAAGSTLLSSGSRKRVSVSMATTRPCGETRSASASATVPVPAPSSRHRAPGASCNCAHSAERGRVVEPGQAREPIAFGMPARVERVRRGRSSSGHREHEGTGGNGVRTRGIRHPNGEAPAPTALRRSPDGPVASQPQTRW